MTASAARTAKVRMVASSLLELNKWAEALWNCENRRAAGENCRFASSPRRWIIRQRVLDRKRGMSRIRFEQVIRAPFSLRTPGFEDSPGVWFEFGISDFGVFCLHSPRNAVCYVDASLTETLLGFSPC